MRKTSKNYLSDTNLFVKQKGFLNIKIGNENYSFKDNLDGVEDYSESKFLGHYKAINKLLIEVLAWESGFF